MAPIALKEESEYLLPIHEKEANVEIYEIVEEPERPKRPLWRRCIRGFLTISVIYFAVITFIPMMMRPFMGCNMGHHMHHSFDPALPMVEGKPKSHYKFKSDIDYFFIKEESQKKLPGPRTDVRGKVVVTATDKDHATVDFNIEVSDDRLWEYIKIQPQKKGIVFSADPFSLVNQHVNITANVQIPSGAKWKGLYIGTRELNIKIKDRLADAIEKYGLESVSGRIRTPGDEKDTTHAGWTKVRTVSGDISGAYTVIKGIDVASASGDVDVKLHAAAYGEDDKVYVKTTTVSGTQKVHVVHPLRGRHLDSSHKSVSGKIDVRYPEEAQGQFDLSSVSGLLTIEGKNVEIIKKEKDLHKIFWRAIKGDKNLGYGKVNTVSADINVSVGDL